MLRLHARGHLIPVSQLGQQPCGFCVDGDLPLFAASPTFLNAHFRKVYEESTLASHQRTEHLEQPVHVPIERA